MTIQLVFHSREQDLQGNLCKQNRYVVLDKNGHDICGHHMTYIEAQQLIKEADIETLTLDQASILFHNMVNRITEGTLRKWKPTDFASFIRQLKP